MKIIIFLLLAFIAWQVIRVLNRPRPHHDSKTETMVRCQVCGTHIPASEAICRGTTCFCSAEHEQAFDRQP